MGKLDGLSMVSKPYPCRIRTLLEELEPSDSKILLEAVNNLDWKAQTLSRALAAKKVKVSGAVISRHRKKECSC